MDKAMRNSDPEVKNREMEELYHELRGHETGKKRKKEASLVDVGHRLAAGDLDVLDDFSEDVFEPLQKLLDSLLPVLERVRKNRDALGDDRAKDVEALLRSLSGDVDVSILTGGYRKFRWRDLLLLLQKMALMLKELDSPLEEMAGGKSASPSPAMGGDA